MRFPAIIIFLATTTSASAFVPLGSKKYKTFLSSLVEPSAFEQSRTGRTKDEIAVELASGKRLEGGHVIDFSSVKGESRAEKALAAARESLLAQMKEGIDTALAHASTSRILGINDEVVQEVGHPLGTFADSAQIQRCASYLRSLALPGILESTENADDLSSFTHQEKMQFRELLRKAYHESGEVTGAFAKTFYMGTQLLPEPAREAIWAVYVWCRRTDEIVDAPREKDEDMLSDLSSWEIRLENLWKFGAVEDVFDLCLLDVRIKYPSLSIVPFVDMIRGMLMDVPGLGQDRYDTFDELHLYCYRVAGTVGLMSMPIFGCAPGYNDDVAR
jgi:phytoene synthase